MVNVFDSIPLDFFNCLVSNSNNRVYSACLEVVYEQYDKEISYRIPRAQVRDVLALYLLDNHIELKDDNDSQQPMSSRNDAANSVIRKFYSCGWITEEVDDSSFEKFIVMTDNGIALADFLQKLKKPATPEFSSYILNIYNRFRYKTSEQRENPYTLVLKPTFTDAKALSFSLKKLSTSIKNIIETMFHEGTLVSLTENVIQYCDGDFIKEYSRLVKQQNIHVYRNYITKELEKLKEPDSFSNLCGNLMKEDGIDSDKAKERILEMIDNAKKFLHDDYNKIMGDIKQKINTYIRIAIARERMLRNKGFDLRGNVEQTIRYLIAESETNGLDKIDEEIFSLFNLHIYEFIDRTSVFYPRKTQSILQNTETDYVELSNDEKERQHNLLEKESHNPYSKEKMKQFLEAYEKRATDGKIDGTELPYTTKNELLSALAAVTYANENGFTVTIQDDYIESNDFMIRHWRAQKNDH